MNSLELPRPLAFVFSGGLARAASQIGMCQEVTDFGVSPDFVVGTSTGAINGAVFAQNPMLFEQTATDLWQAVATDKALSSTWRSTVRGLASNGSGRTQTMLRRHLELVFGTIDHDELAVPLSAVMTDLGTGHSTVSASGSVVDSLISSAAFPIIMPPTPQPDGFTIDGSVVAGIPIRQALLAGARSAIVFDTGASEVAESELADIGWYEVLALAFTHLVRGQADHDLQLAAESVPVIVISQDRGNPFSLKEVTRTIPFGRDIAAQVLRALVSEQGSGRVLIDQPGLYGNYQIHVPG